MKPRDLPPDPRTLYVTEKVSLPRLADLYKGRKSCSLSQLKRRCSREQWRKARSEHEAKVAQQTEQKIAGEQSDALARHLGDYLRGQETAGDLLGEVRRRLDIAKESEQRLSLDALAELALLAERAMRANDLAIRGERSLVKDTDDPFRALLDRAAAVEERQKKRRETNTRKLARKVALSA